MQDLKLIHNIGDMPNLKPTLVGSFAGLGSGGLASSISFAITGGLPMAVAAFPLAAGGLWLADRYIRLSGENANSGWHWLTDPPKGAKAKKPRDLGKENFDLSAIYQKVYLKSSAEQEIWVRVIDDHPRFTVHVIQHDDLKIAEKSKLEALARNLDIETEAGQDPPFQIVHSWGGGRSAIIFPKVLKEGENPKIIPFDRSQVVVGKLVSFLGLDVRGRSIRNDRNIAPHMLISGTTGSGKTILFRNEIFSMKISAPNAIIYSIDYKGGIESAPHTKFTDDMVKGVQYLKEVKTLAEMNWKKIHDAGYDNWFEYEEDHPGELAPIFLNIDELPQFINEGNKHIKELYEEAKAAAKAAKEKAPIKPDLILDMIGELLRVFRSAGVFVTLGIQKPLAKILPTEFRDMLDARAAMRVPNATASDVAIDAPGAENLPEKGGLMFRLASKPIQIGAAAFMLPAERAKLLSDIS